ncbi:hypothetical protein ACA910_010398 [Epithemia clementina (nom. ined.)]
MSSQQHHAYNNNNDDDDDDDDSKNNDSFEISLEWEDEELEDDEEELLPSPELQPKTARIIKVELPREFGIMGARLGDRNRRPDPTTVCDDKKNTDTNTNDSNHSKTQHMKTNEKDHDHPKNNHNHKQERNKKDEAATAKRIHDGGLERGEGVVAPPLLLRGNHSRRNCAVAVTAHHHHPHHHKHSSHYSLASSSSSSSWATVPGAASWGEPSSAGGSLPLLVCGQDEAAKGEENSTRQIVDSLKQEPEDSTSTSSSFVPVHGMGALGIQDSVGEQDSTTSSSFVPVRRLGDLGIRQSDNSNNNNNTSPRKTKTRRRSASSYSLAASSLSSQQEASYSFVTKASNATSSWSYLYNDNDKDNDSITTTASSILSGFDMLDINGQTVRVCPLDRYRNAIVDGSSAAPTICQGCGAALVANPCPDVDYQIAWHLQQKEEREALVQLQVAESKRQRWHERPLLEQADALVQELHQRVRHNFPFLVLPPLPAVSTTNHHHHHKNRSNAGPRSSQSGLSPLLLARMSGRYRFLSAMDLRLGAARFIETVQERYGRSNSCSAAMREAVEPPLPVHLAYMFTSKYDDNEEEEEEEENLDGNRYHRQQQQQRSLERGERSSVEVLHTPELAFQYWKSRNPLPAATMKTTSNRWASLLRLPPIDEDNDNDNDDDRGAKTLANPKDLAEWSAVGWMVLVAPGRLDDPRGCGYSISNPLMPYLASTTTAATTTTTTSSTTKDDDESNDVGAAEAATATTTTAQPQASAATAAATTSSSLPPPPRKTFTVKSVQGTGAHLPLVCFDASVRNDAETTRLFKAMEQTCLDFLASLGVVVTNTLCDDAMLDSTTMPPPQPQRPTVTTQSSLVAAIAPSATRTTTSTSSTAAPVHSNARLLATDAEAASMSSGSSTSTTTTTNITQPVPFPNTSMATRPVATLLPEAATTADCERLANASPSPMLSTSLNRMTLEQENNSNKNTSVNNNVNSSTSTTTTDDAANTAQATSNIQNSASTSQAVVEEQGDLFLELDGWQMHYCPSCDELIRAFIPCPNGCLEFDENNDTHNSNNSNSYLEITATSTVPSASEDPKLTTGTATTTTHANTEAPASSSAGFTPDWAHPSTWKVHASSAFGEPEQTKLENTILLQPVELLPGFATTVISATTTIGQCQCTATTSSAPPQGSNHNSQPPSPLLHNYLLPLQQQSTAESPLHQTDNTTAPSTLPTVTRMLQQFSPSAPYAPRPDENVSWRRQESRESSSNDDGNADELFEDELDPLQRYSCDESDASSAPEAATETYNYSDDDDGDDDDADDADDGDNESWGMV